jgi:acyl carrier protein
MKGEELRTEIIDTLVNVIPEINPSELDHRTSFRDQYSVDSIDYLNFVMKLEKKLDVSIPESDYPKLSSLEGCMKYLSALDES